MHSSLDRRTEQLFDMAIFMARSVCVTQAHPVIGGGAVRDALLDRPIKDIDVFVPAGSILPEGLTPRSVFPDYREVGEGMIAYLEVRSLEHIVSLGMCGALEIQVIEYDPAFKLHDTFDIGLCRVSYGPHADIERALNLNSLRVSEEFLKDAREKTLTVISPNGAERTKKRIERLRLKYPEFTPVWPAGFNQSLDEFEQGLEA